MIFSLRRAHAFSLVEVAIALGIAGFCLLAVFGLMPIGVQTNRNATSQSAASNVMAAVVADMRAAPKTTSTSSQYGIALSPNSTTTLYFDGQGQFGTSPGVNSRYRLTVNIPTNPAGPNAPTFADLKVTWPAAADPATTTPNGSVETFAAFDRN
jgi:uncharacterized protein (TIGR02598 family)